VLQFISLIEIFIVEYLPGLSLNRDCDKTLILIIADGSHTPESGHPANTIYYYRQENLTGSHFALTAKQVKALL